MSHVALACSVYFLAAATPGPSQFFILERALLGSRRDARWAALGVSVGTLVWVGIVIWGLGGFMTRVPQARGIVAGLSVSLLYFFGLRNLKRAYLDRKKRPVALDDVDEKLPKAAMRRRSNLAQGMLVNLLNPNSVVFFVSLFGPLLATGASTLELVLSVAGVGVISVVWYQLIAEIWRFGSVYEFLQRRSLQLRTLVAVFYLYWGTKLLVSLVF
jgi:threonine/homoserine/homoserine lactone efflux protein